MTDSICKPHPSIQSLPPPVVLLFGGLLFAAIDFGIAPAIAVVDSFAGKTILAWGGLACIAGQYCLLSTWLAWGEGAVWRRSMGYVVAGSAIGCLWFQGFVKSLPDVDYAAPSYGISWYGTLELWLPYLPLTLVAIQAPLWLMGFVSRFRLVHFSSGEFASDRRSGIAQLLGVMTLFAILLRWMPITGGLRFVYFFTSCVSIAAALCIFPLAWATLRARPSYWSVAAALIYTTSLTAWAARSICQQDCAHALFNDTPPVGQCFAGLLAFPATLLLGAAMARLAGYRLVFRGMNVDNSVAVLSADRASISSHLFHATTPCASGRSD